MLKNSMLTGLALALFCVTLETEMVNGADRPIFRGQSPNGYPPRYGQAQQYAQPQYAPAQYAPNGVRPAGFRSQEGYAPQGGPAYEPYGSYNSAEMCDPYCRLRGRVPPEWNRFVYKTPRNLTYPAPNQMPGVIQYPYYTCKGPDCFFYQGTSNRQ